MGHDPGGALSGLVDIELITRQGIQGQVIQQCIAGDFGEEKLRRPIFASRLENSTRFRIEKQRKVLLVILRTSL
jgi:hypothetical protein